MYSSLLCSSYSVLDYNLAEIIHRSYTTISGCFLPGSGRRGSAFPSHGWGSLVCSTMYFNPAIRGSRHINFSPLSFYCIYQCDSWSDKLGCLIVLKICVGFEVLRWNGWWWKWVIALPGSHHMPWRLLVTYCIDLTPVPINSYTDIRSDAKDGGQCNPASQESVNKQSHTEQWYDPEQNWKLDQSAMKQSRPNEAFNWQTRKQSNSGAQVKASSAAFGPGRPQLSHMGPKCSEVKPKQQQDVSVAQRRPKPTMPKVSVVRWVQLTIFIW
jgi:hypothetical protein